MSPQTAAASARVLENAVDRTRGKSKYFLGVALALLAVVAIGFSRTLFLRPFFAVPPIPFYLFVHGFVLTSWFLLLVGCAFGSPNNGSDDDDTPAPDAGGVTMKMDVADLMSAPEFAASSPAGETRGAAPAEGSRQPRSAPRPEPEGWKRVTHTGPSGRTGTRPDHS